MRHALLLAALFFPLLAGTSCQSLPGKTSETPLWDRPGWTPHPTHPKSMRVH
ncbi:MAG: hypothetical protein ACKO2G_11055 [Verrucomicrobiales bacterium]